MEELKSQLTQAKADIESQLAKLEVNKEEMDAIIALIDASDKPQADKDFAKETYKSAYHRNDRMLMKYKTAKARLDTQLLRCDDAGVKAKVDDLMLFFTGNSVKPENSLSEGQLYQSSDAELDRLKQIKDNEFLNVEQKTKLLVSKLILD